MKFRVECGQNFLLLDTLNIQNLTSSIIHFWLGPFLDGTIYGSDRFLAGLFNPGPIGVWDDFCGTNSGGPICSGTKLWRTADFEPLISKYTIFL